MKIKIKLFALGRELVGKEEFEIEVEENTTAQLVVDRLKSEYPKLSELNTFLVAVNMEYADMEAKLNGGDEIAIIPPVSGG